MLLSNLSDFLKASELTNVLRLGMSAIDNVVELLKDDKWHSLSEISKTLGLKEETIEEIIQFLVKLGFVTVDKKFGKALINPELREIILIEENHPK